MRRFRPGSIISAKEDYRAAQSLNKLLVVVVFACLTLLGAAACGAGGDGAGEVPVQEDQQERENDGQKDDEQADDY